jgi:hypothetical protein
VHHHDGKTEIYDAPGAVNGTNPGPLLPAPRKPGVLLKPHFAATRRQLGNSAPQHSPLTGSNWPSLATWAWTCRRRLTASSRSGEVSEKWEKTAIEPLVAI